MNGVSEEWRPSVLPSQFLSMSIRPPDIPMSDPGSKGKLQGACPSTVLQGYFSAQQHGEDSF